MRSAGGRPSACHGATCSVISSHQTCRAALPDHPPSAVPEEDRPRLGVHVDHDVFRSAATFQREPLRAGRGELRDEPGRPVSAGAPVAHPGLRFLAQLDAPLSTNERATDAGDADPLAAVRAAARAAAEESCHALRPCTTVNADGSKACRLE
ncbi:hypothetical protein SAMN02787144_1007261 [Streptomyces atratus]|uniref:Uncharacterized protein n=1 Tax=Streptomyces atratus TaxID=1893 RepID=A0A1K2ATS7_STRAR|nr:hypothetical protein SAMN02787144_1007261 [Streptomyces atratus]